MELALQPQLSPQGDPAAPQTCQCQSVQLQGCFQRLCRKVALQLWAPVVASALLQLGSLQLHKALLLSGAAGGTCVLRPGEVGVCAVAAAGCAAV